MCKDNIKMGFGKIECGLYSNSSEHDPVVGFCEYDDEQLP
jgi:hypothetical protein